MKSATHISPSAAFTLFNIPVNTLSQLNKNGSLKCIKTKGGHRRYLISDIIKLSKNLINTKHSEIKKNKYFKKPWKIPNNQVITLTNELLNIQNKYQQEKEKNIKPFWNSNSEKISKQLWLPGNLTQLPSKKQSWFSINEKTDKTIKSFSKDSFVFPKAINSNRFKKEFKPKKEFKTIKFLLKPTNEEKIELQLMLDQFRWSYNSINNIVSNKYSFDELISHGHFKSEVLRDLMKKYDYVETETNREFVYSETRNKMPIPNTWNKYANQRIPRGAVKKYSGNINSAISNFRNKNTNGFQMKYKSRKEDTNFLLFEDSGFPKLIRDIKSQYTYRTKAMKRSTISFKDVFNDTTKKGLEIVYEKPTGKYFLYYPVSRMWFPKEHKRRDENQVNFKSLGNNVISLDPGIRKFLVGYDPNGKSIFIGENVKKKIMTLLLKIDKTENSFFLRRRLSNLITELHWKTIRYLLDNYDTIVYTDFRVSEMIRSKKLTKMTKRLMNMYSFHKFREKLEYKCNSEMKELIIVNEDYTSCTCSNCGMIMKTGGNEVFKCSSCKLEIDRDIGGSRNILLKNIKQID